MDIYAVNIIFLFHGAGMDETVERILNGKFDYDRGTLEISKPRFDLSLFPGGSVTESFFIKGSEGKLTEGTVYTSDLNLTLLTGSFSGVSSEIGFTYTAKGLTEGDVVQSKIKIVSNRGEYSVPVTITVERECPVTSSGPIKNLFHFANLARSSWDEAVKLFYSDEFINVFRGNELKYRKLYLGLSRSYGNEVNVEEFLMAINKKQPIEYIPEKKSLALSAPINVSEENISITKNGWGYTHLDVTKDGDFIGLQKYEVSEDDFLGNFLNFPVMILPDRLHDGINYGKVTFFNTFVSFSVEISVSKNTLPKIELSKVTELAALKIDVITYYEAFREKRVSTDRWLTETSHLVDRILMLDGHDILTKLYKAQILIMQERFNEAKWLLDQAEAVFTKEDDTSSARWAYYLYLTALVSKEESLIETVTEEVSNIYTMNPSKWQLAWMLLYLSREFAVNPSKRWLFIEETVLRGSNSPVIFEEAVNMLYANPELLTKLGTFEIKVLRFMVKRELMNDELINRFTYLASSEKEYSEAVFNILAYCYEIYPTDDAASIIATLLIKADRKDAQSYFWYRLAIEHELRVTKVYEYYMQSLDLNKDYDIPKMVFLYFGYDSTLPWQYNAYLYARIILKKDEHKDIFESYKPIIESFAISEVLKGHINRDMAVVYRFVLENIYITAEMADALSKILFVHRVRVKRNDIIKAVIYENSEDYEQAYTVENGEVYLPIYGKDYTLLFEDGLSNRFLFKESREPERLMIPSMLASRILKHSKDNLEFDVYAIENSPEMVKINEDSRERYQRILDSPRISASYKSTVRSRLMEYYFNHDGIKELDGILESLEPLELTCKERKEGFGYLIIRGMFDTALDWICKTGIKGLELKDIVNLTVRLIQRSEFAYDEVLLRLSYFSFSEGSRDEVLLKYLSEHYKGLTKELRKIFNEAVNANTEIFKLCERMLAQMLYTGYFIPERGRVYKEYIKGDYDGRLCLAFITEGAYDYFVKDRVTEEFVFTDLAKAGIKGETPDNICKLAVLKYYSEGGHKPTEEVRLVLKSFVKDILSEGIYMSFLKAYREYAPFETDKFNDYTIVEYRTDPSKKVYIHFTIGEDAENFTEYTTEKMRHMYGGVFSKFFILFSGESLLYYITEEKENGEEELTESASIKKSDLAEEKSSSRYKAVNDIVTAKTKKDYSKVNELLYEYRKHAYIVNEMFKMM